jgi:translocation and assembly module TamB
MAVTARGPIIANVRVNLGEDVTFSPVPLRCRPRRGTYLLDLPDRPTRATGTLVIEKGSYRSYGQDLTVTNGQVRFNGPAGQSWTEHPRGACRERLGHRGDFHAGSLKEPDVRLYSNLAMSQTQTLSYIVTGGRIGGSGASGNLVNKALSALGIGGSSQVINALGQDIGLSSARIQTEGDLQDASLVWEIPEPEGLHQLWRRPLRPREHP